jgi:uncharacterized protein (DUF302 family)
MKRLLMAGTVACVPASALADNVIVPSTGSVPETVERLKASIEAVGARVFCGVDFGGGVGSVGTDIGDLQLVIFGDARIGAEALSIDRMAALDLPAKVLVYGTESGTEMAYEVPSDMLAESEIPADAPILQVMADTLHGITEAAAN